MNAQDRDPAFVWDSFEDYLLERLGTTAEIETFIPNWPEVRHHMEDAWNGARRRVGDDWD